MFQAFIPQPYNASSLPLKDQADGTSVAITIDSGDLLVGGVELAKIEDLSSYVLTSAMQAALSEANIRPVPTYTWCAYDNFDGPSLSNMNGRASSHRGGSWVKHNDATFTGNIGVNGAGAALLFSGGTYGLYSLSETPTDDQVICCDCNISASSPMGLVGRMSATTPFTGYFSYLSGGGNAYIFKRTSGTSTQLAVSSGTYTAGNHRMELRIVGTTLTLLIDGVVACSATDSTHTTGKVGIYIETGSTYLIRFWASPAAPSTDTPTYLIAGQSNASGMGTNNQEWVSTKCVPWLYGNDDRWRLLTDPFDYGYGETATVAQDVSAAGSWLPSFVTSMIASLGRDIAIVPSAKQGVAISSWAPGSNHSDRTTLYGNANVRANAAKAVTGRLDRILWWQGETDAINSVSTATYKAALVTLADSFYTDTGAKIRPCILQNSSGITDAAEDLIRAAVKSATGASTNILLGPDLSDIASDDSYHPQTDAKLTDIGKRWADKETRVTDPYNVLGNAATATALRTARTINGVSFDGSSDITVTAAGSTLSNTVTVAKGGTGLTALGTGLQVLRTNSGATAMEWATPSSGGNVSNSGTPTSGQSAEWNSSTTIIGVDVTGSGNYVKATSPTIVTPTIARVNFSANTNITEQSSGILQVGTTAANVSGILAASQLRATYFIVQSGGELQFISGSKIVSNGNGGVIIQNGSNTALITTDTSGNLACAGITLGSGTRILKILSATATLDFGSVSANSFADLTITVIGAALGDTVSIGVPNGSLLNDISFFGWVSATNTVTVRCSNVSSTTARDPASGTFRATVTQF